REDAAEVGGPSWSLTRGNQSPVRPPQARRKGLTGHGNMTRDHFQGPARQLTSQAVWEGDPLRRAEWCSDHDLPVLNGLEKTFSHPNMRGADMKKTSDSSSGGPP
ncbi:MAG: hypothetical protein KDK97_20330, partial [Verrucomicrobiales bacterium]|nr:hypothetical protein [Verrucomicrobiales bacterium]